VEMSPILPQLFNSGVIIQFFSGEREWGRSLSGLLEEILP